MAVKKKTLTFLPGIFRTDVNRKFLGSTLDQLINDPELRRINGYIGRTFSPTYNNRDSHLVEPTRQRQNYQFEPSIVIRNQLDQIEKFGNYSDIINKINYYGGNVQNHDRLFANEFYNFTPHIDLDKLVNYSQYYWMPYGLDPVTVSSRSRITSNAYSFSISSGNFVTNITGAVTNPTIDITRGAAYTFSANVAGQGNLWIQTEPGLTGTRAYAGGVSSRTIVGVTNNGTSTGNITLNLPAATAQDDLLRYPLAEQVDYAITTGTLTALDNSVWTPGTSIGGQVFSPEAELVFFINPSANAADWVNRSGATVPVDQRTGIWRLDLVVDPDGTARVQFNFVRALSENQRVRILDGQRRGAEYYKNTSGNIVEYPAITAPLTELFYQNDQTNISGRIRILSDPLNINVVADIIGKTHYTTPNGIEFTNGLMVRFDSTVDPMTYHDHTYIVEGVGTGIRLIDFDNLINPEQPVVFDSTGFISDPQYIVVNRSSIDGNAWSRNNRWFHIDTITQSQTLNGQPIDLPASNRAQRPIIEFDADLQLFNHGRAFLSFADHLFDGNFRRSVNSQLVQFNDIANQLIGRSFADLRAEGFGLVAGQRVIFAHDISATVRRRVYRVDYQDQTSAVAFDGVLTGAITTSTDTRYVNGYAARFFTDSGVGYDIFTAANAYIGRVMKIHDNNIIELEANARVAVSRATGIQFVRPRVALAHIETAQTWHSVPVKVGYNNSRTFWFDDRNSIAKWNVAQSLTYPNQEPLFDIVDDNAVSFGSDTIYPASDFTGTKIFSYRRGATAPDSILGFSLSYAGTANFIGDINFVNNYETDTFLYKQKVNNTVIDNKLTGLVRNGYLRRNISMQDNAHEKLNMWAPIGHLERKAVTGTRLTTTVSGSAAAVAAKIVDDFYVAYLGRHAEQGGLDYWTNAYVSGALTLDQVERSIRTSAESDFYDPYQLVIDHSHQYQHVATIYDGLTSYFEIGVIPDAEDQVPDALPTVRVFVNNRILIRATPQQAAPFSYQLVGARHTIKIDHNLLATGDRVDIFFKSSQVSSLAYFSIPENLEFNPLNNQVTELSLGQMRNHLYRIGTHTRGLVGDILSKSNIRNIDTDHKNGTILQHSAGLGYAGLFLLDDEINFIDSLDYARREYTRFKNKFLELATTLPAVTPDDIPGSVDSIMAKINGTRNQTFPFYYSDMIPYGDQYLTIDHVVSNTTVRSYATGRKLQDTAPSNRAVLVYKNGQQLVNQRDYTFTAYSITITSAVTLAVNDQIQIREYTDTRGSYVPETPSKLGLYPKFIPGKSLDNTFRDDINVIRGHDGSLTPAFEDIRDQLLLELETRIYNNIKVDYDVNKLDIYKFLPGRFRTTDYSLAEFNNIVNTEFLKWIGSNAIDFNSNNFFLSNDEFSYNYSRSLDRSNQALPGYWRGIYKYYYDTDRPHTHPWEMLGHYEKPNWWDTYYSWTDSIKRAALIIAIGQGYTQNPSQSLAQDARFQRPGFGSMVPVSTTGVLLSPLAVLVKDFNSTAFNRTFAVGDHGPVESAWRRTSEYAFALQRTMALMKPAQYFGLLVDTSRYVKKAVGGGAQFVNTVGLRRFTNADVHVNGYEVDNRVTYAAGYLNWIHGYLMSIGIDAAPKIKQALENLDINLSYRVAGFTDKRYITVMAEQFGPNSVNESVVIPDENYHVHLNRGVPVNRVVYSGVILEKSAQGWTVTGYNQKYPFFTIIPSETTGRSYTIEVLDQRATVFQDYREEKLVIPYGFEFTSRQQVVDFLVSYQRYLRAQGFRFETFDKTLAIQRDWILSAREFLTWSTQGWKPGSVLVLSPVLDTLTLVHAGTAVSEITNRQYGSQILNANFKTVNTTEFTLLRDNSTTKITTISGQTIAFADLDLVQYEHVLVFDNRTVFNDIVYLPELGNRQYRLRVVGSKTRTWDGELTPAGFIYIDGTVADWSPVIDYHRGDIVSYKQRNYTSLRDQEATRQFNLNFWSPLDTEIETGLMPNFAHNAQQFSNIYDVDLPPANEVLARFSSGLIGYRSRPYLAELGMDETAQTKFYQGYIKEKGTLNAIEALGRGRFDNVTSSIEIYEEWAARIGEFGAIDSNPEVRMVLTETRFNDNPIVYEFLDYNDSGNSQGLNRVYPNNLLERPLEYNSKLFLNRNEFDGSSGLSSVFKIEMFGDSVICGQEPQPLTAYSIAAIRETSYKIDVYSEVGTYSVKITDKDGNLADTISVTDIINIVATSNDANEIVEYVIETADTNEQPSTTSRLDNQSATTIYSGQKIRLVADSIGDAETLEYVIEPVVDNDQPGASETEVALVFRANAGGLLRFGLTSIPQSEVLYYTIETPILNDQPNAATFSETGIACVENRANYRVDDPPDYLLYEMISQDARVAITTRSVGDSTSSDLLLGTDGANAKWPDQIDAEIVIINHGMRDAAAGIPVSDYRINLEKLRQGLDPDVAVIWVLPAPVNTKVRTRIGLPDPRLKWTAANNIMEYRRAMLSVANQRSDYVADPAQVPGWTDYLYIDGIHPDQAGYRKLVEQVIGPRLMDAIKNKRRITVKEYEDDIITAGYVNVNDVDELWFDILTYAPDADKLDSFYSGYRLWLAKDYNREWQVYRFYLSSVTLTSATVDLDNKFTINCSLPHGLLANDIVVIRYLDDTLDGLYRILEADERTITVLGTSSQIDYLKSQDVELRNGEMFDLQPLRFKTLKDRDQAQPKHYWQPADLVYVDDTGLGNWGVYSVKITSWANVNIVTDTTSFNNVYTVLARDCGDPTYALTREGDSGETIHFCVTSIDTTETDLYWTVEVPLASDAGIPAFLTGNVSIPGSRTTVQATPYYGFTRVKTQTPVVDIESVNNIYLYSNKDKRILTRLDLYDPAKGRVLGTALQDIDFTVSIDPAQYRVINSSLLGKTADDDHYWGAEHVGEYWWDIDRCRFIDYEQTDLLYRVTNWGRLFPGSSIEVYEWIESNTLPSLYVANGGSGTPLYPDDSAYSVSTFVDPDSNALKTHYYFWVRNRVVKEIVGKRHTTTGVEQIIANPIEQNIPFMAALRDNSIALYNVGPYVNGTDTVLYVSGKKIINENIIHSSFQLIQEGNEDSKLPARAETKIIDSICGLNAQGNTVPDQTLPFSQRLGFETRPLQTVIVNKLRARENVIKYANSVMIQHPLARRIIDRFKVYSDNFFAEQLAAPADYDDRVRTFSGLGNAIPANGRRVLVDRDETVDDYWAIYRVELIASGRSTAEFTRTEFAIDYPYIAAHPNGANYDIYGYRRVRRQSFSVRKFWDYADWYAVGFGADSEPDYIVDNYKDIYRLELADGDLVRVKNVQIFTNSGRNQVLGDFELYQYTGTELKPNLVGLGRGTLQISDVFYREYGFDSEAFDSRGFDFSVDHELRYIMAGLKEDLFVADLENEYNKLMYFIVDYILSEQKYIDWFLKTSFITVKHSVDGLVQRPSYIRDRQENYEQYINEVKPYRTKIREYVLNYKNIDLARTAITDFDLPAYYDRNLQRYRSPNGDYVALDNSLYLTKSYRDWYDNYRYQVRSVDIVSGGYGYHNSVPAVVTLRNDTETGANAEVRVGVDLAGSISSVRITNTGTNYRTAPSINIVGSGATAASDRETYSFQVVARGLSDTTSISGNIRAWGLYSTSGTVTSLYTTAARSYTMHRIRRSDGQVTHSASYDVFGSAQESARLAADLYDTSSDYIVVVHTYDEPRDNRLLNGLDQAMYRCGASEEVFGSTTTFRYRSAYVLVGIPGGGEGTGIENFSGNVDSSTTAYCSLNFQLYRGFLAPVSANPRIYTVGSPVSFPVNPVLAQEYTYANKQWTWRGNGWIVSRRPISSLSGETAITRARLVPRLENYTVRKIRTVIRFDRVSYTTQVEDWQPGVTYSADTYLHYQGQGYRTTGVMLASNTFNFGLVIPVGSNINDKNRSFLDGFFDNANDRIMSFYVPTESNFRIPKNISKLVPGISPASGISSNGAVGGDTILIGDTFGSNVGISAGNIQVDGGNFVSNIFSYAPEELLPGQTFDSLSIRVLTSTTPNVGFRLFVNMANVKVYTTFTASTVTTLAQPLNVGDATITVADASVLSNPDPVNIIPGIVMIGGERITYYTKVGNVLGQLRRGVDGTGTPLQHPAGTAVENASAARISATPQT